MRCNDQDLSCFNYSPKAARNVRSACDLVAKDPRIQRALELIKQGHPRQIGDIATYFNLSSSRFRHLFKKEVGMSPKHCLRLVRLERAKELLENSFLRLKEVTAVVGVNDISHFVRDYKMLYGQTPSQTRARSHCALRIASTASK
jgi:AraC family transcriptional regulator, arabinose operon regulatory protein